MSDCCNGATDLQEVEVDQRALVNILSRYPGTFDVLRELIQNADDADARSIEIHFQTEERSEHSQSTSNPDVSKIRIRKWFIKNEGGGGFKEKDWKRLGKIAAGNDNSTKVGAFGVGFYSVLSKSDRPLVRSNGKLLQFERGEDGKLRKRFTTCPLDPSTTVELELRKLEMLPVLADLTRFLVSSVAFLTNIDTISVHLDSQRIVHMQKQSQPPVDVSIPGHLNPTTPSRILTVESIQYTVQKIVLSAEEWAFVSNSASSLPAGDTGVLVERPGRLDGVHPMHASRSADGVLEDNAITHDLYTATVRVNLDPDPEMKKGVESCMKSLPTDFKSKVVYFDSDQYDSLTHMSESGSPESKHLACLFFGSQGIVPESDSGRLFIGQSTNQTTGIGLHVSAHFLPTMERGSIDLANGQVKAWNKEVLCIGGLLARVIYEKEMNAAKSKDGLAMQLGLRTMARFAFGPTVPHSGVSQILQEAFFSCGHEAKSPLPVVSDVGISYVLKDPFRQSNKDLSFLKKYPTFHDGVEPRQRSEIIRRYGIPLFKFEDIVQEFQAGVTQDAMKLFLVWWDDVHTNPPPSSSEYARNVFCKKFASKGVLHSSNGGKIIFKNIKYFTFFALPNDLSPPDTIYIDAAQGPSRGAVECFGWTQLSLLHWLRYACSQAPQLASSEDNNSDSNVGYRILHVIVQFALVENLSMAQWDQAAELMKGLECVPTGTDIRFELPSKSYFDTAAVCMDLPVARESDFLNIPPTAVAVTRGFEYRFVEMDHIHKVLSRIKVRNVMDWEDMIRKLEANASEETNYRLLRYLATIHRGKLIDRQINDLKQKRVFYSENHGPASANELLLPDEDVRKIGLPILALPRNGLNSLQNAADQFGPFTMEQFIVDSLGIQRYPSLKKIVDQAASDKLEVRRPALRHLLANLETYYNAYKPEDFTDVAFIPTKGGSLARPNEVFASPIWEKLGLQQVSEELYRDLSRLGVKKDPSVETIIDSFKNPRRRPSSIPAATELFEHLHLHGNLPIPKLRDELSTIPFVPVENLGPSSSESSPMQYSSPKDCFIESEDTNEDYRGVYPFVNFGPNGNSFLESCGTKKLPDASDTVRRILQGPQIYLDALGKTLYLEDMHTIASHLDTIPDSEKQAMKKAPMFPAERNGTIADKLLYAEQVFISDWVGRDFSDSVSIAPKDDLEKMYLEMGSVFLGTYVRHDIFPSGVKTECRPEYNREQIILRIRCFMRKREEGGKTDVSFYEEGSTGKLHVKACKGLKLKKTFTPPFGILVDSAITSNDIETIQVNAGFKFNEDDESHTLWMVGRPKEVADLRNDISVALCHVLLKTYGPNDVLLLASFFTMSDDSLVEYYGKEMMPDPPSAPDPKEKPPSKIEELLHRLKRSLPTPGVRGFTRPGNHEKNPKDDDLDRAMTLWGELDSDGKTPDFTASSQPHPTSPKNPNNKCKQIHAVMLKEMEELQMTDIKFFMVRGAKWQPPEDELKENIKEFAEVISCLARVFGGEASTSCCIFWKDGDEHLMAFNRNKYIYLNLAHYHESVYNKQLDKKEVMTEWYLMMAHEIAHNVSKDHDEYHGSIYTRLAITHFPAFRDISW